MELIQPIQAIMPVPLIRYCFPLLILGCFLLAFRELIHQKWRTAVCIYALSVLTGFVATFGFRIELETAVAIGGIFAPTVYSLVFVLLGAARTLKLPAGGRSRQHHSSIHPIVKLSHALLGACVGGMLGALLGAVFSLVTVALILLLALPPIATATPGSLARLVGAGLSGSIYLFGELGIVLGFLTGLGWLNGQKITEKLLIYAVISSAITHTWIKKLLGVAGSNQLARWAKPVANLRNLRAATSLSEPGGIEASGFEVIEQSETLTLRRRTYRAFDWVWIGFNGLYDLFALLVGAIALWRGTWTTLSWGIGIILGLGLIWTWYSLTKLLNSTLIVLNSTLLIRQDAPLISLTYPVCIPLRKIGKIKAIASCSDLPVQAHNSNTNSGYHVYALLTNGTRVPLLKNLDRWEEALFVEDQVARFRRRI